MKISILVPTYNEEKNIGKTLESISAIDKKDWDVEILVIDGGSKDKTKEVALSYGVKVLVFEHRGIGYAREMGLESAKGEIVAFTDADTTLPHDWLIRHVGALKKPGVVFSFGSFRVKDGSFPYYHFINYLQPIIIWVCHNIFSKPVACGQNMAFWKVKAMGVGGFDKNIRVMEDTDLAIRIRMIGKVVYQGDLIVISSGRRSKEGWGFFSRMMKSLIEYFLFKKRTLKEFPDYR